MNFEGLIGPSYSLFSPKAEIERSMNVYLERIESGQGRNQFVMYRSPGQRVFGGPYLTSLICRGLFLNPADNSVLWAVFDDVVWAVPSNGFQPASFGINTDGLPVSIDSTLQSLFVVSAGVLYRLNINVYTPTTDFIPEAVAVLSGLVIALARGTNRVYFSSDDGQTWPALNFQTAEAFPNQLINLIVDHQELWLMGNRRTEVYVLGGDATAPLVPVSSGIIEMGLAAKNCVVRLDNSLFWLGANANGDFTVVRANGYTPVRVSNHAVENAFRSYGPDHSDAIMSSYQLNGHSCLRITFPSANQGLGATWEFDISVNSWTEVGWWNAPLGRYERHRANFYVSAFGKIISGDHSNGFLYELTPDEYTDFGYPLRIERRAPHVTKDGNKVKYSRFDLFMQPGVGLTSPLWLSNYSLSRAQTQTAIDNAVIAGDITIDQSFVLMKIYDRIPYTPLTPYPAPDVMNGIGFYPWGAQAVMTSSGSGSSSGGINTRDKRASALLEGILPIPDGDINGGDMRQVLWQYRISGGSSPVDTVLGGPPEIQLRYSNDGGNTYTPYYARSIGRAGEYLRRIYWNRLGMGRDRVWEISGDAPVKIAIVQGTFDAEVCNS